jgi:hypothetical protein
MHKKKVVSMYYEVFPFGKYKGVKLTELPSTYIVLALEKFELPDELSDLEEDIVSVGGSDLPDDEAEETSESGETSEKSSSSEDAAASGGKKNKLSKHKYRKEKNKRKRTKRQKTKIQVNQTKKNIKIKKKRNTKRKKE